MLRYLAFFFLSKFKIVACLYRNYCHLITDRYLVLLPIGINMIKIWFVSAMEPKQLYPWPFHLLIQLTFIGPCTVQTTLPESPRGKKRFSASQKLRKLDILDNISQQLWILIPPLLSLFCCCLFFQFYFFNVARLYWGSLFSPHHVKHTIFICQSLVVTPKQNSAQRLYLRHVVNKQNVLESSSSARLRD